MNSFLLYDFVDSSCAISLTHGTTTYLSADDIIREIKTNYTERVFWTTNETKETVQAEFKALLQYWWSKRGYHYARLVDALELEYSAIENVSKYETYTDTKIGNDTRSTGTDSTTDLEGTTTVDTTTTDNGGNSLSENAYNQSSVVSQSGTNNNTNIVDNDVTVDNVTTFTETTTSTGTNAETITHEYNSHGNVGVTSNVELLSQEKNLRENLTFIAHDMVTEFVDLYTTF